MRTIAIANQKEEPPKNDRVLKIHMLDEDNVRKGIFEHDEYETPCEELPE